jgi:hypothetical protein
MSPQANRDEYESDAPSANEILASILEEVGDLSNLIELFYLSREPGALDVLRWVASLPEKPRRELIEFIRAAAKRKKAIRLKRTGEGALVLAV